MVSDLKEGKVTLPIVYAMEQCTPAEAGLIETVLREQEFKTVSQKEILSLVNKYQTVEKARSLARRFAAEAHSALQLFPSLRSKRPWKPFRSLFLTERSNEERARSGVAENTSAPFRVIPARAKIQIALWITPGFALAGMTSCRFLFDGRASAETKSLDLAFFSSHSPRPKAPAISTCSG